MQQKEVLRATKTMQQDHASDCGCTDISRRPTWPSFNTFQNPSSTKKENQCCAFCSYVPEHQNFTTVLYVGRPFVALSLF